MTRDEAIERLHQCSRCNRWITTPDCDHCYMDRLPAALTPPTKAVAMLTEAIDLGERAKVLRERLRLALADEPARPARRGA